MAEDLSYWICKCGVANHRSDKFCRSCKTKKSRRGFYWVFFGFVAFVFIAINAKTNHNRKALDERPSSQIAFLAESQKFDAQIRETANPIAHHQILELKYRGLVKYLESKDWVGKVIGVNMMQGKGALIVDIGGVTLVAGDALSLNRSTLIEVESATFKDTLLQTKVGDLIKLTGHFAIEQGKLIDIGGESYLFYFQNLSEKQ
jgi:hypothetical protein